MIISLCGFMGAGKSTLGKNLARYIGGRFIDLDEYLEHKLGCSVGSFFAREGEVAFRGEELKALEEILRDVYGQYPAAEEADLPSPYQENPLHPPLLILSLGGGTVTTAACASFISTYTRCIYLQCPKEVLLKRLLKNNEKRPLLAGKSATELESYITELMKEREPLYRACAHAEFEVHPHELLPAAVERICTLLLTTQD